MFLNYIMIEEIGSDTDYESARMGKFTASSQKPAGKVSPAVSAHSVVYLHP